jgi:glycosyltransferase involved in cell wall biosynthesis
MKVMDKKIKVVHIVDDLKVGGLERTLALIVLGLDKDRYDTSVWCLAGGGAIADELRTKGVEVKIFNFASVSKHKAFMELVRALKVKRADITHSWGLSGGVLGGLASILTGVKVRILHVQNMYDDTSVKERVINWFLSLFTTVIISCAEAVKGSLVQYMHIDNKKIHTIYNSVDLEAFGRKYEKATVRTELGIAPGDIVVGSASRLVPQKGQSYLLKAAVPIMHEDQRIKILIVGDGPSRPALEIGAGKLGIADRVIFTGVRTDMPRIMQAMDIFVLPSTVREGLPLTVAEAHASSLPVIATDVGGNGEIVINMKTGLLVPPMDVQALTDALKLFLNNKEQANEMGRSGRRLCETKFSSLTMIKSIEALYYSYAH